MGNPAAGKSQVVADPHKFLATVNNGSKRGGISPQNVSLEARQIAQQYKQSIYPAIRKFSSQYTVLPKSEKFPQLKSFLAQGDRSDWHIGTTWRLDNTIISRDVYSKNQPNEPHDPWAYNDKYQKTAGKWGNGFIIYGWDDGRVTFDAVEQEYTIPSSKKVAPPGAAGIPPSAKQGITQ